ncbi:ABC transporter permease [Schumannella sp. 10F1B-5-1]|uniref:ABC transporter permease n=1 Tax=Schumannella sp. 10F1B-5-1 TaxID=2590780 RepID=UPI001131DB58|nr:ABC transporter permease [Schumannella sp. 10F1B-5-1]TPW70651.1 ABC transporter permease [Schumannella sp. 10F1B-5-1]
MTTATLTPSTPRLSRRLGDIVRLHLANPMTVIVVPLLVLTAMFAVMIAIALMIVIGTGDSSAAASFSKGFQYSGTSFYIFVYMMVVAVQAMNATFAYALGLGVTRRDYYLGSAVTWVLFSVAWSILFLVLGAIEQATRGWGMNVRMFTAIYYGEEPVGRAVIVFCAFLFFFFAGTAAAAVFVRWKALGVTVMLVGLAFVLVGLGFIVTLTANWPAVGAWFVASGPLGVALWSLVLTALLAVAGWALLRRATPRG